LLVLSQPKKLQNLQLKKRRKRRKTWCLRMVLPQNRERTKRRRSRNVAKSCKARRKLRSPPMKKRLPRKKVLLMSKRRRSKPRKLA
jgi:hypothetical protein